VEVLLGNAKVHQTMELKKHGKSSHARHEGFFSNSARKKIEQT